VAGVESVLNDLAAHLPAALVEACGDIPIHVAANRQDLAVLRRAVAESRCDAIAIPQDFRGVYLGAPIGDDDDEEELPDGVIVLNAAKLRDVQDVLDTLLHEYGHALGLDEDEVAALGLE